MKITPLPKPVRVKESQYEKAKRYQGTLTLKRLEKIRNKIAKLSPSDDIWVTKKVSKMLTKRPRRAGKKVKRVKLPTIRSLILKADKLFASYIRNRDGNKCVLCGSTKSPTCGHLIKRGKKAVRWSEVNCNCLCMGCNYKDNFDHEPYVAWFLRKYGQEAYLSLIEKTRGIYKVTRIELNYIIEQYSKK